MKLLSSSYACLVCLAVASLLPAMGCGDVPDASDAPDVNELRGSAPVVDSTLPIPEFTASWTTFGGYNNAEISVRIPLSDRIAGISLNSAPLGALGGGKRQFSDITTGKSLDGYWHKPLNAFNPAADGTDFEARIRTVAVDGSVSEPLCVHFGQSFTEGKGTPGPCYR